MNLDEDLEDSVLDETLEGEETEEERVVPVVSYEVSSYGSDPEVEVLVSRIRRGDIVIPPFQRDYVWRQPEASKFIESLLLGLPVPGIFFAVDPATNKQLVIDGQQRLRTLQFFFDGYFNPKKGEDNNKIFSLVKVQEKFEGKTYSTLDESDRVRLETSIIHATTVKQTSPSGDDTSMYHIFERLNSGGRRLTEHEMRVALYHGLLMEKIKKINLNDNWRGTFGKPHSRLKDQELILRFFAIYEDSNRYERPMGEFLNKYSSKNRSRDESGLNHLTDLFNKTLGLFVDAIGGKPFRLKRTLNVAVYDSCMFGLATRIESAVAEPKVDIIKQAYDKLLQDSEYVTAVSRSTADEKFVALRLQKAVHAFKSC